MRPAVTRSRLVRWVISAAALGLVAYLSVLAVRPSAARGLPAWLRWFGQPGSWQTIAVVAAVLAALCVLGFRTQRRLGSGNVPITVIAGLAATGAVLGFSSYWNCHDATHPPFITPLMWTASLVKGGISDMELGGHVCPHPTRPLSRWRGWPRWGRFSPAWPVS